MQNLNNGNIGRQGLDYWLRGFTDFKTKLDDLSDSLFLNGLSNKYIPSNEFSQIYNGKYNLAILHINIHCLNSKLEEFCHFISVLKLEFDVIVISEIWSTNICFYHNILPGYQLVYDLPATTHVGGVGLFINVNISFSLCKNLYMVSNENCKVENVWIRFKKGKRDFCLGGIYRHPVGNIDLFTQMLEKSIDSIPEGCTALIAGDTNINLLRYDSNAYAKNYMDMILMYNFLPVILLPTRFCDTTATLIDHIYVRDCVTPASNPIDIQCGNIVDDISDHLSNFCLIGFKANTTAIAERPLTRVFSEKNNKIFYKKLSEVNWKSLFADSADPNVCYERFSSMIKSTYEDAYPLKTLSRRAQKNKSWFTPTLKKARTKKLKLYNKWLRSKSDADKYVYYTYKQAYEKLLNEAKVVHYKNQFNTKMNSIKDLWSNLKFFISTKPKSAETKIEKLLIDGRDVTNKVELSNKLNQHFCSIGSKITSRLPPGQESFVTYLGPSVPQTIFVEPVEASELCNIVNSLKVNKAPGDDGFTAKLVKENINLLMRPLLHIYNLSLTSGICPKSFKLAKVIPIFKKGDVADPNNYRPISLLPVFNKILEKIVCSRIRNFVEKHNLLYRYQFGFRENYSTTLAVMEAMDYCYDNIDKKNLVLGLFLDLEKAFDTVQHEALLAKLYHYGIRGLMYNWLSNYLHDRCQYTVVNGVASERALLPCGLPQGSVLSPLLFLLFINDIHRAVQTDLPRLFADDTSVFLTASNEAELQLRANEVAIKLEKWLLANRLSLNVSKTNYIVFNPNRKTISSINLNFFGQNVQEVTFTKFLGLQIDKELTWKAHIEHLCKNLVKFCGIFYKIRSLIPPSCAHLLYYAFVHSNILYGIEVYANTCPTHLEKLSILNNKIIRILFNKPLSTHVKCLYETTNSLPVHSLHEFQLIKIVHKAIYHKNKIPEVLKNYFCNVNNFSSHFLRNEKNLKIIRYNTNLGQRCLKFKGPKLWNPLPDRLKNTISDAVFPKYLKTHVFSKYFEN